MLSQNGLSQREALHQLLDPLLIPLLFLALVVGVAKIVIFIGLQQDDAARILIAKQRDGIIGFFFQIPETDNIAEGFDRIQDTVGPGKCLDQAVHFQVFVYPKGIQGGGIKASQEHIDHQQKIHFPLFHPVGEIFVVILESLAGAVIIGLEDFVIVANGHVQEISGTLIQQICFKAFLGQHTVRRIFFVGRIGENSSNGQVPMPLSDLLFQFQIILFADRNGTDCKDGIKSIHPLTFQAVPGIPHGLLIKVIQNICYHF